MKVTKSNIVLIVVVSVMILAQLIGAYNGGCLPGTVCWGPRQIKVIGIPFSPDIGALPVLLLICFAAGLIVAVIHHRIKKESVENSMNVLIKVSSIIFIILMLLGLWLKSQIAY